MYIIMFTYIIYIYMYYYIIIIHYICVCQCVCVILCMLRKLTLPLCVIIIFPNVVFFMKLIGFRFCEDSWFLSAPMWDMFSFHTYQYQ